LTIAQQWAIIITQSTNTGNNTMSESVKLPSNLKQFISRQQLNAIIRGCKGEEKEYFFDIAETLGKQFATMAKTYEQDGKGDDAIVYLHYFRGGMDWFITEKDMEDEQHQAFGMADIGYGGSLGYISLNELMENNIELDFHWTPKTLREVKASRN